jgi:C4-type Zn-finger protein
MEKKVSKRQVIKMDLTKVESIDWTNFWENRKKQEEEEQKIKQEKEKKEQERIEKIKCPACKSTKKQHYINRENNGIIGPGFNSWITEEYLICQNCGIHYSDLNKNKK